ncbi:MAG: ATP-dependent endonuclease [Bacteroidetes bacterium GWA2_32_17]|nr:MAG: ATP-dependent endonuclease [Bacteroidetes bacterium GWA2_32_17]
MKYITKIKLYNFKRFKTFSVEFNDKLNLLVGDNESGKSSILEAINLVLSGSKSKVEATGLENLFNSEVINNFLNSDKNYNDLPKMYVELYFNEQNNFELNGRNNSDETICDGLKLECIPNEDLSREIKEILEQKETAFPFEFYIIKFNTFQGDGYSGYKKYLRHILVDNSQISSEYAIKEYVKDMYNSFATIVEKNKHQNDYRKHKELFKNNVLNDINSRIKIYDFTIRNNSKSNLETDLTLSENAINIENKGKGIQCFIKTEFALSRNENNIDVILLEEPENHLSHINMKKMIRNISGASEKQIFITTHSNMISTRLDLRKSILLNSNSEIPILLNSITESTAKFFIKAPDNNLLDFVLSKKVILVEGDAEFILMESFFKNTTNSELDLSDIHIISVNGTSFKRYLEIAKELKIKTAVIRDNDGNYQQNCIDNYDEFVKFDFIKVFSEKDNTKNTFEVCLYSTNQVLCDNLFLAGRKTLTVKDYMLKNKAEAAYELLEKKSIEVIVPEYIKLAIEWIKK